MKTDGIRAHHALLHAMALDKNYIDVTDDSLATIAVNHYKRHGDQKYLARALYYLGLSYFYSGEYNSAIIEFTRSEKVAEKHDSEGSPGKCNRVPDCNTINRIVSALREQRFTRC